MNILLPDLRNSIPARVAFMRQLGADLAKALAAHNVTVVNLDEYGHSFRLVLGNTRGGFLYVGLDQYKHRLNISCNNQVRCAHYSGSHGAPYSVSVGDFYPRLEPPSVTIGLTKSATQIANDIARRVLPQYAFILAALWERADRYDAQTLTSANAGHSFLGNFAALPGEARFDVCTQKGTVTDAANGVRVEFAVTGNGSHLTVTLPGLTPAQAAKLAEAIHSL